MERRDEAIPGRLRKTPKRAAYNNRHSVACVVHSHSTHDSAQSSSRRAHNEARRLPTSAAKKSPSNKKKRTRDPDQNNSTPNAASYALEVNL